MITIADDEPDIVESTQMLLQVTGHDAEVTTAVEDILPLIRATRPTLHLQDVQMPGLDIARLIREIRADASIAATPVVLFTAASPALPEWQRLGADACLSKPFEMEQLHDLIASAQTGGREAVGAQSA